ncbi:MAG TPA: branched-chain amino acid ABC transporter permease, partial [Anaerolineae bacterium]|nr:branched-chain amino acid ABC transporter permease [Anaerolineae bacterium]
TLGLIIALITVFVSYIIYHSRFGLGLFAIRDDEAVAEGLGVPTFRYKMAIFALSCFFIGLSGALHALQIGYITVEGIFSLRLPLFVILMSILGGRQHWLGPVIGAVIIFTLTDTFSKASIEYLNQIIIGFFLFIMILFLRDGIYERLKQRLWSSLAIMVISAVVLIVAGVEGRLISQLAYAMLITVIFLLLSDKLYQKFISPFPFLHPKKQARVGDA